jgi:hypothetical protein
MLSFLLWKRYGKMSDKEAKALAEKEAAEEDLRREKAKVRWLCWELARHDRLGRSAESWAALADLYAEEK